MMPPKEWSRFVFKTDPKNGLLIGPDGCHYPTEKQAFHYAFLGLCGCGSPEEAYNFCLDVLRCFDRRKEWREAEAALAKIIAENPNVAAHVLAHLLNKRKLIEHGSSVSGSWLTAWGEQIVDAGSITEDELD